MIKLLIELFSAAILSLLILCLIMPRARKYFLYTVRDSLGKLWEIVADYAPGKQKGFRAIPPFLLALTLALLAAVFFIAPLLLAGPAISIIKAIKHPKEVDDALQFDKDLHAPLPKIPEKPKKTPEEIAEENRIQYEKMMSVMFTVDRKDLQYDPDENEVFFFTPESRKDVEDAISSQYHEIKSAFEERRLSFVFLPIFNREINGRLNSEQLSYYNPKAVDFPPIPNETLSYQDFKEALKIPDKVNGPCFVRCRRKYADPLEFSFYKIDLPEDGDMIPVVLDYLSKVGGARFYSVINDEKLRKYNQGKPAEERYYDDIYLIGKEIKERIEQLRAKGLTSLAIRKLIGDISDSPGKMIIDSHNRIFLPDYNKEIKLSPIHKAVFFLFLNHPEGILFKDLPSYREELGRIYGSITGRDDRDAIDESLDKLTNPFDNSINEKCARIKNAFVSEFREEIAQWYFIDGKKGEKKTIKLPRDLVIWDLR